MDPVDLTPKWPPVPTHTSPVPVRDPPQLRSVPTRTTRSGWVLDYGYDRLGHGEEERSSRVQLVRCILSVPYRGDQSKPRGWDTSVKVYTGSRTLGVTGGLAYVLCGPGERKAVVTGW